MRRQWFITVSLLFAFSFLSLNIVSSQSQPGTINGTVKDPNGAVVAGAQVTVRNEATGETRDAVTDNQGRFKVEGLAPGGYKITINRDGFKTAERAVAIESGKTASVEIKFEIVETRAEVTVPTKGSITPNADPNYRALRDGDLAETYEVTNLTLKRDVGVITLRSGRVSFLPPILGKVAIGGQSSHRRLHRRRRIHADSVYRYRKEIPQVDYRNRHSRRAIRPAGLLFHRRNLAGD